METLEILFLSSLAVVFYTYVGYGLILYLVRLIKKPSVFSNLSTDDLPHVTHVIAAYNEEQLIDSKIENCLSLDYPKDKLTTIIVADGSSDETAAIVRKYPEITLFYLPERKGKLAAVDRVMKEVKTSLTVFSDANSMLNPEAVRNLVRHFSNPQVGAVAGEKVVVSKEEEDAASAGEGMYWKYESFLKRMDYELHSVVGAAGELFAVRTELYHTPGKGVLIEDFVITMNIAASGHRVAYEPAAKASELASPNIKEELKRKVRISAGGLQAIWMLRNKVSLFKDPILFFQYFSHRALRWTLAPLALVLAFVSSLLLVWSGEASYVILFLAQVLFYIAAFTGYLFESAHLRIKALFIPFYFSFMNLSVFLGLFKLIRGNYSAIWEKAERRLA